MCGVVAKAEALRSWVTRGRTLIPAFSRWEKEKCGVVAKIVDCFLALSPGCSAAESGAAFLGGSSAPNSLAQ
jgi:hypothetical protein